MNSKHLTLAVAIAGLLLAIGYGLYRLGMNHGMQMVDGVPAAASAAAPTGAQQAGGADSTTGKKVLYWHDPMAPGQKFDKPGKSPFMDMQLVPVYADGGADGGGGVAISPRVQQNLGVRTAEVKQGVLSAEVEAVGSVAYNERDVAVVQARANGFLERLYVRAPLDPVRKGQPLAALYVPDWVAAQEEFLATRRIAASTSAPDLKSLVDGARQRMRLAGMTDAQIARVESVGKVEPRITVVAPIAGVLAELGVREGTAVTAGMPIARINGLATVWINAELPEALAARVRVGDAVEAKTPGGVLVEGKVGALLPEVNAQTRTLKVRVEVNNARRALVPGMFATLRFRPTERGDMLLIPSEAIIATGTRTIVMLAEDGGRFMPVEVTPGVEANGKTEIRKGLKAGQKVVLSGQFLLDSEASLKGVEARQVPADDPARDAGSKP